MSHELTIRKNGTAEMAYVGDVPWHGLGQQLQKGATKKQWIKAAGWDFDIMRAEVRYQYPSENGGLKLGKFDNRDVLYRSDNNVALSVVSNRFQIVQPAQIMDYFEELAERCGFELETAGTLFDGRQYWALANIGDETTVLDPKDRVKGRLLLATSCDKSIATTGKFLAERVVCHNTLTWGLAERGGTAVKVNHSVAFDPQKFNEKLGIVAHETFAEQMEKFRRLAATEMDESDMIAATVSLIDPDAAKLDEAGIAELMQSRDVQRIGELAFGDAIGSDLDGGTGTAWGWLNSVTQFVDHEGGSRTANGRLNNAWFGKGDRLKSRALEIAVATANGDRSYNTVFENSNAAGLLDQVLEQTAG